MAGFQVCLEAVSRGDFLLAPNPAWPVLEKLDFLRDGGVTHLSLTPSQARQCLFSEAFRDLRLRQVTLGGEIADQRILDSLSMTFPWAKITHVYASTETGPIMAISDKKAGFPSESHFLESKRLLIAPDGEIGIRTENGNVLWTGDLVEKRGDRYFFLGRKNGLINVGGAKVHPERVEATLLEIDWVDECRVFGLRNSQLGQIVGAELVARNPPSDFRSEIRRELKSKLSRVEIPQVIELVEEIAQSSAGKKARSA